MSRHFFEAFYDMISAETSNPIFQHPAERTAYFNKLDTQIRNNQKNGNLLPSESAFLRIQVLKFKNIFEQQVNN